MPSIYRGQSQDKAKAMAEGLAAKVAMPNEMAKGAKDMAKAYKAALELAKEQRSQLAPRTHITGLCHAYAYDFNEGRHTLGR